MGKKVKKRGKAKNMKTRTNFLKATVWIVAAFLFFSLFFSPLLSERVKADEASEIWTYEDLLQISEHPEGSFLLMADIDLAGRSWTPVDFRGSLEGNGHALLNVSVTSVGAGRFSTYDGNMIEYETAFAGLFSSLVNASVSNLKVLGIDISLTTDAPTFVGGIAGYMENSSISSCTVYGAENLTTSGHSFGVGGIAGFGNGKIENTSADMTLVCTDTDTEYKDEQFMGGAYAAGYIDLSGNAIRIAGYDSDHGYVHNGGLVGMYILYPEDTGYAGYITGNTVEGMITFFEDNEDRRAYCEASIGEIMNWSFAADDEFYDGNFTRNEVFDYAADLTPHPDASPSFEETVVPPTETENGYTVFTCQNDGYSFRADFTPVVGNYVPEPEPGTDPSADASAKGNSAPEKKGDSLLPLIIIIVVIVLAILVLILILGSQKKKQSAERQRAERQSAQRQRSERQRAERARSERARSERPGEGRKPPRR